MWVYYQAGSGRAVVKFGVATLSRLQQYWVLVGGLPRPANGPPAAGDPGVPADGGEGNFLDWRVALLIPLLVPHGLENADVWRPGPCCSSSRAGW